MFNFFRETLVNLFSVFPVSYDKSDNVGKKNKAIYSNSKLLSMFWFSQLSYFVNGSGQAVKLSESCLITIYPYYEKGVNLAKIGTKVKR